MSTVTLNEICSDNVLRDIAFKSRHPPQELGTRLNLEISEINNCTAGNESVYEKRFQVLYAWKRKFGHSATYRQLLESLGRCLPPDKLFVSEVRDLIIKETGCSDSEDGVERDGDPGTATTSTVTATEKENYFKIFNVGNMLLSISINCQAKLTKECRKLYETNRRLRRWNSELLYTTTRAQNEAKIERARRFTLQEDLIKIQKERDKEKNSLYAEISQLKQLVNYNETHSRSASNLDTDDTSGISLLDASTQVSMPFNKSNSMPSKPSTSEQCFSGQVIFGGSQLSETVGSFSNDACANDQTTTALLPDASTQISLPFNKGHSVSMPSQLSTSKVILGGSQLYIADMTTDNTDSFNVSASNDNTQISFPFNKSHSVPSQLTNEHFSGQVLLENSQLTTGSATDACSSTNSQLIYSSPAVTNEILCQFIKEAESSEMESSNSNDSVPYLEGNGRMEDNPIQLISNSTFSLSITSSEDQEVIQTGELPLFFDETTQLEWASN